MEKVWIRISGALMGLTIISFVALLTSGAFADNTDVVDDVTITVPAGCNLRTNQGEGNTYSLSMSNGQYKNDIGDTEFTVSCNVEDSFAIYAIGYSGDEYGKTTMLSSDTNAGSTNTGQGVSNIPTGTATSGDVSQWAMKLTPVSGTITPTIDNGYNNFSVVPETYTKVASIANSMSYSNEAKVKATYAVYISPTQAAATYTGKVKYTVVHPHDGEAPTPDIPPVDCPTKVPNLTYMQELSSANKSSVLASMTEDEQYYLKDSRDEKTYCVSKLKDGNIWMTQNLDHDISTSFVYTPANTDIPANWTPDKSTYPTGTTTWATDSAGYNIQQSYDPGNKIWDGTPDPNYSTTLDNMAQGTDTHYHMGNYYNWGAAVAMNDTSSYTTQYQDLNQSICPAGWTLPKGGNNTSPGSSQYLISQYGWDSSSDMMENPYMREAPLYFPLSGGWDGLSFAVASYGGFWSSVVYSSYSAYALYGNEFGYVYPGLSNNRGYGFSVRCLSR